MFNLMKIQPSADSGKHQAKLQTRHEPNDYGSRTPVIKHNPNWTGFTVHEWARIDTTDERKRYK